MRAREVVGWEWEGLHRTSFTELYFGGILFYKEMLSSTEYKFRINLKLFLEDGLHTIILYNYII